MTTPRLSTRISDAALSAAVARTFAEGLREVASRAGVPDTTQAALIRRMMGEPIDPDVDEAPFEALWPHARLFLTACIYVALADGQYRVEEARIVSHFAHRLGLSAGQLSGLEEQVFRELSERGAAGRAADDARRDAALAAREAGFGAPTEAPEPRFRRPDDALPGVALAPLVDTPLPTIAPEGEDDLTEPGGFAHDVAAAQSSDA